MIRCMDCGQEKDEDEFYWKDRPNGVLRNRRCKSCKSVYNKTWYEANKAKHMADVMKNSNRATQQRRQILRAAKEKPCQDCGVQYPFYVMDLDHVRGQKRKNVSQMINGHKFSIARLLEEIAKCDVVCANCHRERTFSRLGLKDKALAS